MNLRPTHLLPLLAAFSVALAAPATAYATPPADGGDHHTAPTAVGLTTDQRLVSFQVNRLSTLAVIGDITGLTNDDTSIIGIDYRVSTGALYGVGNAGGIYTLDTTTAVATFVVDMDETLDPAATAFGVDFNPVSDLLRIVSNTGQNLHVDVVTGDAAVDTPLTYPPDTTTATGISAVAYTNNDTSDTTGTTLLDIDTNLDQVAVQSPPNDGLLVRVGALGVEVAEDAGFDIHTSLTDAGVASDNAGYATLAVLDGTDRDYGIFTVNLTTGAATQIGDFPGWAQVSDLAVQLG